MSDKLAQENTKSEEIAKDSILKPDIKADIDNEGKNQPKKVTKKSSKILLIIVSSISLILIIAIALGGYFYSRYQTAQKDSSNNNYSNYVEAYNKTVEVYKAQDVEKIENKEQAELIKTQINNTQELITQKKNSQKTNQIPNYRVMDKKILTEFENMNQFLDRTIVKVDLDWCAAPQYREFISLSDKVKSLSRDSKFFDTFANLQARFELAATLTSAMQSAIEKTLQCFDSYLKDNYPLGSDLRGKIEDEMGRYKRYVGAYKEMSQAAKEQNNTKLLEAQKKIDTLFTIYFESSLKIYFSNITLNLKQGIAALENDKTEIEEYKNNLK